MQLAFAVADIANPVYIEMMRAIEEITKAAGFRLVLHSTGSDSANEIDLIEGLGRRYADGLILSPLRITPTAMRSSAQNRASGHAREKSRRAAP